MTWDFGVGLVIGVYFGCLLMCLLALTKKKGPQDGRRG